MTSDKERALVIVAGAGGASVLGYRYLRGRWPWEAPPVLRVTGISLPSTALVGETFSISADVENTGESEATGTVVFTRGGEEIGRETLTVPPKTTSGISIPHSIPALGDYRICAEVEGTRPAGVCVSAEVEA